MKKIAAAALALLLWPSGAGAYIDHFGLYTLRFVIENAATISVVRVEKISREKNVIVFSKVADLKGVHPDKEIRHDVTGGFRPREPRMIMTWAEPGRTAVMFSDGQRAQICAGSFWYEVAIRKDAPGWGTLTHVQSILSYAYYGSVETLRRSVTDILAGKEVVIPAIQYTGDSHGQRLATYKNVFRGKDVVVVRVKASLKMAHSPLDGVEVVGKGGEDLPPLPTLLARLKDKDARALTALLADPDKDVRWAAADALGEMGPASAPAVPALLKLLGDPDPEFRSLAADVLGTAGVRDAAALLTKALQDGDRRVRESAARSLLHLGLPSKEAAAILAASKEDPWVYAVTLAFLVRAGGPEAVPFVCDGVKHPNHEVRMAAANLLLQVDPRNCKQAIDVLIAGLKDPHYFVSARCARTFVGLGAEARQAAPALLELLKHPHRDFWEPRSYAAVALSAMGIREKAMVPALVEALQQPSYQDLRLRAAATLGALGADAKPALGALREAARDKDPQVAKSAAEALKLVE